MAAGSCLTSALVDFTCSLHPTRHLRCCITSAFHAFSIHSKKMYGVLFLCHGLCLPGAGVKVSMGGRDCVYLIYLSFPSTRQRAWHTEGVQKHCLLNSIIIVIGKIISAHPLATTQREAETE